MQVPNAERLIGRGRRIQAHQVRFEVLAGVVALPLLGQKIRPVDCQPPVKGRHVGFCSSGRGVLGPQGTDNGSSLLVVHRREYRQCPAGADANKFTDLRCKSEKIREPGQADAIGLASQDGLEDGPCPRSNPSCSR